jgi:predicted chitinase
MVEEQKQEFSKSLAFLKIGAKNFLYLKGMARDLNVASQNIAKLVELSGGEARKKNQTDMHILKPEEISKKLEVEVGKEKAKYITPTPEKKEIGVGKAILAGALVKTLGVKKTFKLVSIVLKIRKLFSLSNVLKVVTRFALPVVIISSLWEGMTNAFDEFKQSGSIWKAFKEGVSTVVEFLTAGFIGKDTIKNLMENVANFLKPITDVFSNLYDKITNFLSDKVNKIREFFGFKIQPKGQPPKVEEKEEKPPAPKPPPKEKPPAPPKEKPSAPAAPAPAAPAPAAPAAPAPAAPAPTEPAAKKPSEMPPPIPQEGTVGLITKALEEQGITNNFTKIAVLANIKKEVGKDMQPKSENLAAYAKTSVARIREVFTTRMAKYSDSEIDQLKQNPVSFGEAIYGKDTKLGAGMGNTSEGDGYKYRGRGYIQFTGKNNYASLGKAISEDLVSNPDKVNDPFIAAKMTGVYVLRGLGKKINEFTSQSEANRAVTQAVGGSKLNLDVGVGAKILAKVEAESASFSGSNIGSSSTQVAAGQRQQAKPTTPVVVDARTTNNTVVKKQETVVAKKPDTPSQSTADMLAGRASA